MGFPGYPTGPLLPPWCLPGASQAVQLVLSCLPGASQAVEMVLSCLPGASQAVEMVLSCIPGASLVPRRLFPASLVPPRLSLVPPWCVAIIPFLPPWRLPDCPNGPFLLPWWLPGGAIGGAEQISMATGARVSLQIPGWPHGGRAIRLIKACLASEPTGWLAPTPPAVSG